jgi:hypothetical protein
VQPSTVTSRITETGSGTGENPFAPTAPVPTTVPAEFMTPMSAAKKNPFEFAMKPFDVNPVVFVNSKLTGPESLGGLVPFPQAVHSTVCENNPNPPAKEPDPAKAKPLVSGQARQFRNGGLHGPKRESAFPLRSLIIVQRLAAIETASGRGEPGSR